MRKNTKNISKLYGIYFKNQKVRKINLEKY